MAETFSPISVEMMAGQLRLVADACTGSLRSCLMAELAKAAVNVGGGMVPSGTAANAHSVSFAKQGDGTAPPSAFMEMWSYLVKMYDRFKAILGDTADDAAILAEMLFQLDQPAKVITNSFVGLRYA